MIDLTPTTDRTRAVAAAVTDEQLGAPTPTGSTVAALLQHLMGLSVAFRDAAAKIDGPTTSTPPGPVTDPLPDDWRAQVEQLLGELSTAWQDAGAWEGMTKAGGVDLPGEIGGLVALDEVLLHGWDIAVATGQSYEPSDSECEAVLPIVTPEDADGAGRDGLFGRVVDVPDDAPAFDRVLGLAGRDPGWTP
ncbi:TIGR03086 family metal-binding protein [Nocardioides sp. InS609-2]|uniref:TIGR03086 family metal-binding protein n=1 Tax=Nocardioides sp. InS609-2 TaxID=2760705 RepID=UPI0017F3FDC4|nr:TIGR03086 family metal-binding protein [Nocardioides sp. InS609-2]MBA3780584.1 TIGR03086 family protein [Nocardioides sp.]